MKTPPSLDSPLSAIQKLASDLRDPDEGCPWDQKQNHKSLIKHLVEETYETVDAINKLDEKKTRTIENLKEELGDLLFQIVMHAQLTSEKKYFDLNDISRFVTEKLIHRHPHVYGEPNEKKQQTKLTADDVLINWEKIKNQERQNKENKPSMLGSIPDSLPALIKAYRLGEKVSRVGFDWPSLNEIKKKLEEEMSELEDEISPELMNSPQQLNSPEAHDNHERIQEEFGDFLFVLIQYGRHLNIDPEVSLQKANQKFIKRFTQMESKLKGRLFDENNYITLDEWEKAWEEAKQEQ